MTSRNSRVSAYGNSILTKQLFAYDFKGLLTKFQYGKLNMKDNNTIACSPEEMFNFDVTTEWQYTYNPFNEREQKRMYKQYDPQIPPSGEFALPWEYYQLGANNEQLVVYHGININSNLYLKDASSSATNPVANHHEWGCDENSPDTKSALFIYPVEFNISAPGVSKMRLVLDENGNWKKEFLIKDQVGTTKALIQNIDGMPQITNRYVYGPYGEPLHYDNEKERQGFIGKEKDLESGLADHGVRKYDYISGRFTSTDPLWEKYYGYTPYHYTRNNPVLRLDVNGMADFLTETTQYSDGINDGLKFAVSNNVVNNSLISLPEGMSGPPSPNYEAMKINGHFVGTNETWEKTVEKLKNNIGIAHPYREDAAAIGISETGIGLFNYGGFTNEIGSNNKVNCGKEVYNAIIGLIGKGGLFNTTYMHTHGEGLMQVPTDPADYNAVSLFGVQSGMMISKKNVFIYGDSKSTEMKFHYKDFDQFMRK
ncbi:MAG: hypothetical protein A2X64_07480 [Ignavibacteria bacterium GWF2_33_9]|nr:MAG: hypothetical protein A2X64_07480 [Ignavibacteria bacterium GWF2_33_9]